MTLGYSKKDWPRWVNSSIPLISEEEAGRADYDELQAIIADITTGYKPDMDTFDDMGWRKSQTVKYHKKNFNIGNLTPIDHEILKRWRRLEDETETFDIARWNAEKVTGRAKMNVLGISTGPSGSGKSFGTSHILWGSALWLSDILTGDPAKWRGPFPYWNNVKVIDKNNFTDLFKDLGYQSVKFGDDCFQALNRVRFASAFMESLNTISATDRVFRDISWFSCQWQGMMDIVIRQLASVRVDFRVDPMARSRSLNVCKFHHLTYHPYDKHNPVYNVYHRTAHADVEDCYVGLPPEEMLEWYELYRLAAAVMLKKMPADSEIEGEADPYQCPACSSKDIYASRKDNTTRCKHCNHVWSLEMHEDGTWDIANIRPLPAKARRRHDRAEREAAHIQEDNKHDQQS